MQCAHLGTVIEDPATCGCGVAVLHTCAVHGKCRKIGQPKNGERVCSSCSDYKLPIGQAISHIKGGGKPIGGD